MRDIKGFGSILSIGLIGSQLLSGLAIAQNSLRLPASTALPAVPREKPADMPSGQLVARFSQIDG